MRSAAGQTAAVQITIRPFDALSPAEVHEILRLRAQVFVVEQGCPYVDPDDGDLVSEHVTGREGGRLVAYARIQPTAQGAKVGRVVTARDVRGRALGHAVVAACVAHLGDRPSYLHAQDHLRAFYAAHGYVPVGDVFPEDGIPHVRMERGPRAPDAPRDDASPRH